MQDASNATGTVLNNRYRLVSLLGTGASANVYLADDLTLERQVAVKLLQPALAEDEAFLKRFRAEARAVAALNHPNVLQVYDWGEEDHVPFLVTEYLAGGSLSDLLSGGALLSPEQAALVGQQAASGLAYAHQRGLVHRDVKPANILFDDEGRLRITDFGVARALAEASWTEPIGAMIGTVRYASPEQAEGQAVDGRADVYSLGLVLYEALTGDLPFVGETPLATLRARVGKSLPHNPLLGPLDFVLEEATNPEPYLRLDAAELEQRLTSVVAVLPPAQPLALRSPGAETIGLGAMGAASAATAATSIGFRPPSADELTQATPVVTGPVTAGVAATRVGHEPIAPTVVAEPYSLDESDGLAPYVPQRRRRRWPWIVALLVALVAGFSAVAVATKMFTPSVTVPNVVGQSNVNARANLSAHHLSAVYGPSIYSTTIQSGQVVSQSPRSGASLKQGSSVSLVLSRGLPPVTVPSLTNYNCQQAQAALTAVHISSTCPASAAQYSPTVPTGQVMGYTYNSISNPKSVPYNASVVLVTSKGPAPIAIPSVSGTYAQAQATLTQAGFTATEVLQFSNTVPVNQVIGTSPTSGSLAQKGSSVTVYVSLGVGVVVPNVAGYPLGSAISAMNNAGFSYGTTGSCGIVRSTSPAGGTTAAKGSTVTLNCNG